MTQININTLKKGWVKIITYIILILSILILRPPILVSITIINVYSILITYYYNRKNKLINYIKQLITINIYIIFIILTFKYLGGWKAIIITHTIGGAYILYTQRKFIKQAHTQYIQQIDQIKNKLNR